jgi:hypothetical protein
MLAEKDASKDGVHAVEQAVAALVGSASKRNGD